MPLIEANEPFIKEYQRSDFPLRKNTCKQNTATMGENRENKRSKFELTEQMLVIVDKDWSRTYVATIQTIEANEGTLKYAAKCTLKNASIVGIASDKNQLSTNMDELATIVEDRFYSEETLPGAFKVAGLNAIPN